MNNNFKNKTFEKKRAQIYMKNLQVFIVLLLCCSSFYLAAQNSIIHITDNKKLNFSFSDNGYSAWLKKQKPQRYFYESSLEIINLQYANEWNKRVENVNFNSKYYKQSINYHLHSHTHYGIEINYKLFMYFKYFEEKYETLLERH